MEIKRVMLMMTSLMMNVIVKMLVGSFFRTGALRVLEVLRMFSGTTEQRICIVLALKEW